MRCLIVSSEEKREFNDVKSVTLPAFSGELQILPDHAESFIVLQKGQALVVDDQMNALFVEGGICHIKDNAVIVIL